jgi:hypothetical protein
MIKFHNKKVTNCSTAWSIVSDNVILSDENILISTRFLISFIKKNQDNKKAASFNDALSKLFQVRKLK